MDDVVVIAGSEPPLPAVLTFNSTLSIRALLLPVFLIVILKVPGSVFPVAREIVHDLLEPETVKFADETVTENVVLLDKKERVISLAPPVLIPLIVQVVLLLYNNNSGAVPPASFSL